MATLSSKSAPQFMRAAQASAFGEAADVLTVSPSVARPLTPCRGFVQIAVHACSLTPSDYRMLSGSADLVKRPSSWPYVPGGDVAGVITQIHPSETKFAIGDRVIGTWDSFGLGGLAEYTNVRTKYVEKMPDTMSFVDGAAFADSSVNAMLAVEDAKLGKGDSLLVLGGSGAVGTALIQLARDAGVSCVVATSTDEPLVSSLGADAIVDYTRQPWWEADAVTTRAPFDVVIDCAEGVSAWNVVCERNLLKNGKQGGRFLAVVVNNWHIEAHTIFQLFAFLFSVFKRTVCSYLNSSSMPSYNMLFPAPRGDSLRRLLRIVQQGRLKVIIDRHGPHPFTTDGVRKAFDIMVNRRAHGKVVIKIRGEK